MRMPRLRGVQQLSQGHTASAEPVLRLRTSDLRAPACAPPLAKGGGREGAGPRAWAQPAPLASPGSSAALGPDCSQRPGTEPLSIRVTGQNQPDSPPAGSAAVPVGTTSRCGHTSRQELWSWHLAPKPLALATQDLHTHGLVPGPAWGLRDPAPGAGTWPVLVPFLIVLKVPLGARPLEALPV